MSVIERVAVVGAGTMGHGIAQATASAGFRTALADIDPSRVRTALERIRSNLDREVEKKRMTPADRDATLERLWAAASPAEAVADSQLAIEAVPEQMALKQTLFAQLCAAAPSDAILATNTSSLSISEIASSAGRPEWVVGLHFFNPVPRMRLVEVVRGRQTSEETVSAALGFALALGKEPIVVTDSPGFATSRLGVVLGLEAMRMVEQDVASPTGIDRAMELGYNHPVGPLRLTDLVGLDVRLGIAEYLYERLGGEQYRPPEILRRMVAAGKLGKKSGEGFYRWDDT